MLIAGGAVAGLETLLALHSLAADLLKITILAPELKFVNLSMSVEQPFKSQRVRGLRLKQTANELGASWRAIAQGTDDTHRAHAESTPVHDRGRQRHPGGGQLANLARLVLAPLRFAVERLVEATQDISVPQHPLDPLFAELPSGERARREVAL